MKDDDLSKLVLNLMRDRLKLRFKARGLVMEIRELRIKKNKVTTEINNINNEVDRLIRDTEGY